MLKCRNTAKTITKTFKPQRKYLPLVSQYKSIACAEETLKLRGWNMDVSREQSAVLLNSCWSQAKNDKKYYDRLCHELFISCYQGRGSSQNISAFWPLLYICCYIVVQHTKFSLTRDLVTIVVPPKSQSIADVLKCTLCYYEVSFFR